MCHDFRDVAQQWHVVWCGAFFVYVGRSARMNIANLLGVFGRSEHSHSPHPHRCFVAMFSVWWSCCFFACSVLISIPFCSSLRSRHVTSCHVMPCHVMPSVVPWAQEMMRDEETSQYVDGMAFHWYFATGERLMDGSMGWGAVNT